MGRIPARSPELKDLSSTIAVWKQLCLVNDLLGFVGSLQNRAADFQEKNEYEGNILNAAAFCVGADAFVRPEARSDE